MKRRSARPFMVEVKQTRSARTSLTAPEARPRPDKILWPELAQAALEPPAPAPAPQAAPRPERKVPDAPVRRVLPSLVPMFEVPAEPALEAADDAVTESAAETVPAEFLEQAGEMQHGIYLRADSNPHQRPSLRNDPSRPARRRPA
ncbi:hypothetical protein [Methylobacterium radiotolerans]|uniref:hypothetical protein n=1 Tax=Methylobacterium radiotolerans TaxID=31998 RepID=UPI002F35BD24